MNYNEYLEEQKSKYTSRDISCKYLKEKIEWVKNLAEVYFNQWMELEKEYETDKALAKENGKTFKENEVSATRRISAKQEFETINSIMDGELYYYVSTLSIELALDRVINNYKLYYKQSSRISISTMSTINQLLTIKKEFKNINSLKTKEKQLETELVEKELLEMDKRLNFRR